MDLKFSFGASNPLPLASEAAGSMSHGSGTVGSNVLVMRVSVTDSGELMCEGLSADGTTYARASKAPADQTVEGLSAALRSVLARGGAELPEPLITSISVVELALNGREAAALQALGLTVAAGGSQLATVDEALQARTGITAGTPIQLAAA